MAELEDLTNSSITDGSNSMIESVEIEWLDFDYIKECHDIKKLQAILNTLKSGKEGYYPDLLKYTEEKLISFLPDNERKKVYGFSKIKPSQSDVSFAENDLKEWMKNIKTVDKSLSQSNVEKTSCSASTSSSSLSSFEMDVSTKNKNSNIDKIKSLPPVRGTTTTTTSATSSNNVKTNTTTSSSSISITDPIRVNTNNNTNSHKNNQPLQMFIPSLVDINDKKRINAHIQELAKLRSQYLVDECSVMNCQLKADRERIKGNEHYKAKEYTQAIDCYTHSMAYTTITPLPPTTTNTTTTTTTLRTASTSTSPVAVIYTNRALAYWLLEQLEAAEMDCSIALQVDDKYVKALSKRSAIRFKKGQYKLSILDLTKAVATNPESVELKSQLVKSMNKYQEVEGRAFVYDDDDDDDDIKRAENNNEDSTFQNNNSDNSHSIRSNKPYNDNNNSNNISNLIPPSPNQHHQQQQQESLCILINQQYATSDEDFDSFINKYCLPSNVTGASNSKVTGASNSKVTGDASGSNVTGICNSSDNEWIVSSGQLIVEQQLPSSISSSSSSMNIEEKNADASVMNSMINKNVNDVNDTNETFTRVAIIEENDDDDDDGESDVNDSKNNDNIENNHNKIQSFTRVAITEDDDDDDDDDDAHGEEHDSDRTDDHLYAEATALSSSTPTITGTATPTATGTATVIPIKGVAAVAVAEREIDRIGNNESFTRISIINDDDDDEVEGTVQQNENPQFSSSLPANIVIPATGVETMSHNLHTPPTTTTTTTATTAATPVPLELTAIGYKEQGNQYMIEKKYESAIDSYTRSIKLDTTLLASYNNRAQSFISLKLYKEAIADCTSVLLHDPVNLKALYRRAICYKQLDLLTHALSDLKTFFAIEKSQQPPPQPLQSPPQGLGQSQQQQQSQQYTSNKQAHQLVEEIMTLMDAKDENEKKLTNNINKNSNSNNTATSRNATGTTGTTVMSNKKASHDDGDYVVKLTKNIIHNNNNNNNDDDDDDDDEGNSNNNSHNSSSSSSFDMMFTQQRMEALACLEQGKLMDAITSCLNTLQLLQSSSSSSSSSLVGTADDAVNRNQDVLVDINNNSNTNKINNKESNNSSNNNQNINNPPSPHHHHHHHHVDEYISTYNMLLTCYFANTDYRQVVHICTLLLDLDVSHFRGRLKRAEAYFHLGEYEHSLTDIAAALGTDPSSIEAQTLLNELTQKMGPEVVAKFNKIRNQHNDPVEKTTSSNNDNSTNIVNDKDNTKASNTPNSITNNTINNNGSSNSNNTLNTVTTTTTTTNNNNTNNTIVSEAEKRLATNITKISTATSAIAFNQLPLKQQLSSYMEKGNLAIAKNEGSVAVERYTQAIKLFHDDDDDDDDDSKSNSKSNNNSNNKSNSSGSNTTTTMSNTSSSIDTPTQLSCYYNRAQSYIKCSKYDRAEADAAYVITQVKRFLANDMNSTSSSSNGNNNSNNNSSSSNNSSDDSSSNNSNTKSQSDHRNKLTRLYRNALHLQGICLRNLGTATPIQSSVNPTTTPAISSSSSSSSIHEVQIRYLEQSQAVFQELQQLLDLPGADANDVVILNKIKKEVEKVSELLIKKRKLLSSIVTTSNTKNLSSSSSSSSNANTNGVINSSSNSSSSRNNNNSSSISSANTTPSDKFKPSKSMNSTATTTSNTTDHQLKDDSGMIGMTAVKTTKLTPTPTSSSSSSITANTTSITPSPTTTNTNDNSNAATSNNDNTNNTNNNSNNNNDDYALQQLVQQGIVKLPKNFPISSTTATSTTTTTNEIKKVSSSSSSPLSPLNNLKSKIQVPRNPPKTVYECERIWRSVKSHPDLFADYLSTFTTYTFKHVFKESLSPELLSSLFIALRDYTSHEKCVFILNNMAQYAANFHMMIQLLAEDDIKCIQSIFVKLELNIHPHNDDDDDGDVAMKEKILKLKALYGV